MTNASGRQGPPGRGVLGSALVGDVEVGEERRLLAHLAGAGAVDQAHVAEAAVDVLAWAVAVARRPREPQHGGEVEAVAQPVEVLKGAAEPVRLQGVEAGRIEETLCLALVQRQGNGGTRPRGGPRPSPVPLAGPPPPEPAGPPPH